MSQDDIKVKRRKGLIILAISIGLITTIYSLNATNSQIKRSETIEAIQSGDDAALLKMTYEKCGGLLEGKSNGDDMVKDICESSVLQRREYLLEVGQAKIAEEYSAEFANAVFSLIHKEVDS